MSGAALLIIASEEIEEQAGQAHALAVLKQNNGSNVPDELLGQAADVYKAAKENVDLLLADYLPS